MRFFNFVLTRAKNVLPQEKLASARELILENCDFVVDIGANNGQWISDVRNQGYKGEAVCIEPLKKNYAILLARNFRNTIALNCAESSISLSIKSTIEFRTWLHCAANSLLGVMTYPPYQFYIQVLLHTRLISPEVVFDHGVNATSQFQRAIQ